jgi:LSD1 subclass zinc finger protein
MELWNRFYAKARIDAVEIGACRTPLSYRTRSSHILSYLK